MQQAPNISSPDYSYAFQDIPDAETIALIEQLPDRWGRMPPLCRAVLVETGRFLQVHGLIASGRLLNRKGLNVGLIGVTGSGSMATDLAFAATLSHGVHQASPALFGYTLANIPLAEAANHFGLTGPVYAIMESTANPLQTAVAEGKRLVRMQEDISFMLACTFDHTHHADISRHITLNLTLVYKDDEDHPSVSQVA